MHCLLAWLQLVGGSTVQFLRPDSLNPNQDPGAVVFNNSLKLTALPGSRQLLDISVIFPPLITPSQVRTAVVCCS